MSNPITLPMLPNVFNQQKEFMFLMRQKVNNPDIPQGELYAKLTLEELGEVICAMNPAKHDEIMGHIKALESLAKFINPDMQEVFDGILDVLVVQLGMGVSLDFPMEEGWNEVLRSNMAKINPDGSVTRRPDGKVMKPAGWTAPDLKTILVKHTQKRMWQRNTGQTLRNDIAEGKEGVESSDS
jgi:predicted HAD superfamily Cof-like phosphohydrolase